MSDCQGDPSHQSELQKSYLVETNEDSGLTEITVETTTTNPNKQNKQGNKQMTKKALKKARKLKKKNRRKGGGETEDDGQEQQPLTEEEKKEIKELVRTKKLCYKCKSAKPTVLLRNCAPCRECFEEDLHLKFRSTLFGNGVRKFSEKTDVVAAYTGGQSSMTMMNEFHNMFTRNDYYQTDIVLHMVHVDESGAYDVAEDERQAYCEQIQESAKQFDCGECQIIRLEDHLPEGEESLSGYLEKVSTQTAREDLVKMMRLKALRDFAKQSDCVAVFVGTCLDQCAINMLSDISKGRASTLPLESGVVDNRYGDDIPIVRPMSRTLRKAMAYYTHCHGLDPVLPGYWVQQVDRQSKPTSINQLTSKFMQELQGENNATAFIVMRTGEKMHLASDALSKFANNSKASSDGDQDDIVACCKQCYAPITMSDNWQDTSFKSSARVVKGSLNAMVANVDISQESESQEIIDDQETLPDLCYACQRLFVE